MPAYKEIDEVDENRPAKSRSKRKDQTPKGKSRDAVLDEQVEVTNQSTSIVSSNIVAVRQKIDGTRVEAIAADLAEETVTIEKTPPKRKKAQVMGRERIF